jgi:hypothetical protein
LAMATLAWTSWRLSEAHRAIVTTAALGISRCSGGALTTSPGTGGELRLGVAEFRRRWRWERGRVVQR